MACSRGCTICNIVCRQSAVANPPVFEASTCVTVGVVITTYNHAHFLADSIESVLKQTHRVAEIVVVDDGSTDDPASVVAAYPDVRLVRQANSGLAAARNTGLRDLETDKVIFLDADDRLLPDAAAAGLACFARRPVCGFVYGGYRQISRNGHVRSENHYNAISAEPYRDFLKSNVIGMHAAVMYDRARLTASGGFDPGLLRCEDYDVYLRMSRSDPVASHPAIIAEYRWHGTNMSANHREMLDWSLRVHRRQLSHARGNRDTAADWRRGRSNWRDFYIARILEDARRDWKHRHQLTRALRRTAHAAGASPATTLRQLCGVARRRLMRGFSTARSEPSATRPSPPLRSLDLGDLDRTDPVGGVFGFDRGTPVDRYYIERFLSRHSADIRGRVLEASDDSYCRRFGGPWVTRQDVLDLSPDNGAATIVGDLCAPRTLPDGAFDCLVLTQTFQYIFDIRAAIAHIHRALKPGGVVLVTTPGISPLDRGASGEMWCWSFTRLSAHRLFSDVFGTEHVDVESYGNVYAATAFLHGLALEEVHRSKLDVVDTSYPVVVTVRARKAGVAAAAIHPSTIR
jgi:glycosyltransferase involved in cell wall biosynthesis